MESLDRILNVVADTLEVSTKFVQKNSEKCLREYARYNYVKELIESIIYFIAIMIATVLVLYVMSPIVVIGKGMTILIIAFMTLMFLLLPITVITASYLMSPISYAMEHATKLLRKKD